MLRKTKLHDMCCTVVAVWLFRYNAWDPGARLYVFHESGLVPALLAGDIDSPIRATSSIGELMALLNCFKFLLRAGEMVDALMSSDSRYAIAMAVTAWDTKANNNVVCELFTSVAMSECQEWGVAICFIIAAIGPIF